MFNDPVDTTQVTAADCGDTLSIVNADPIADASEYNWEIVNSDTTITITSLTESLDLTSVSGLEPDSTYSIQVYATVNGENGFFGNSCNITIPGAFTVPTTQITTTNCNDTLTIINADPVTDASGYTWEIVNSDTTITITSLTESLDLTSVSGLEQDSTYSIQVFATVNGTDGAYGNPCSITIPGGAQTTETQLTTTSCGQSFTSLNGATIYANPVAGATMYTWSFVNDSTTTFTTSSPSIGLDTLNLNDLSTYSVQVAVTINDSLYPFGPACNITTAGNNNFPTIQLVSSMCNNFTVLNFSTELLSEEIGTAASYRWQIIDPNTGDIISTYTHPVPNNIFQLGWSSTGLGFGQSYQIIVAYGLLDPNDPGTLTQPTLPLIWSNYGDTCTINTPPSSINEFDISEQISVFPNPISGKELMINTPNSINNATLILTNTIGEIVLIKQITSSGNNTLQMDVADGMYLLYIESEKGRAVKKIIKQK